MDGTGSHRARRSERRRLASLVSVRFSPTEEALVRAAAAARGRSVSGFVREAALREASPTRIRPSSGERSVTSTGLMSASHRSGGVKISGPEVGVIVREIRNV